MTKHKYRINILVIITAICFFLEIAVSVYGESVDSFTKINDIVNYKVNVCGYTDVQNFADTWLAENAGNGDADWYAACFAEAGYDLSSYTSAAKKVLPNISKSTDKLRISLACQSADDSDFDVNAVISEAFEQNNIMNIIYGIILMNTADFSDNERQSAAEKLIALQLSDGGWCLTGKYADADVTAMALQALSPFQSSLFAKSSVEKGIERLSALQQSDGGYKSYGTASSESCSQVILALTQLGIDPQFDERFIKNNSTVIDALLHYQLESGGFSHTIGASENDKSTVQALMALTALNNYQYSGGGFYSFYDIYIPTPEIPEKTENTGQHNNEQLDSNSKQNEDNNSYLQNSENTSDVAPEISSTSTVIQTGTTAIQSSNSNVNTNFSNNITSTGTIFKTTTVKISQTTAVTGGSTAYPEENTGNNIKIILYVTISALCLFYNVFLICRKQWKPKNCIISVIVTAAGCFAVSKITIKTPDEYYGNGLSDVNGRSVTMSVSLETIKDKINYNYMLIPETEYAIEENDTVFDLLMRVTASNGIPVDYSGSHNSVLSTVYIKGINNVYEMEYGDLSGWMYMVNGEFPDCSCGEYELNDGDCVEWVYSRDIGHDITDEEN